MEKLERSGEFTFNTLKQQIENAGIDISEWGKGQTKTLEHLQKEIEEEETVLITGEQGELLRKVIVGVADVFYISPDGKKYHLKEEKQIFKDDRERSRDINESVSEKMKINEDPNKAMLRGIREELGIEGDLFLTKIGTDKKLVSSLSYPGLQSYYIYHKFETILNEKQFKEDGYIEEQEDKNTYFIWEEIE